MGRRGTIVFDLPLKAQSLPIGVFLFVAVQVTLLPFYSPVVLHDDAVQTFKCSF